MLAERRGRRVNFIESARIAVIAIGRVTPVNRLAAKSRITRSGEACRVRMRYASNISFLARARRFLASGLFASVRRGACLRLRSFTAR